MNRRHISDTLYESIKSEIIVHISHINHFHLLHMTSPQQNKKYKGKPY